MDPSSNVQSIREYDFPLYGIQLIMKRESENYVEIAVKNINYAKHKQSLQQWIVVLFTMYVLFISVFPENLPLMVHASSVAVLVCLLIQLVLLVDQEVLKVAEDFGIEKLLFFSFGRQNRIFVPINRVHKIIINEVIYFNRIIFVLQLLTKGDFLSNSVSVLFDTNLPLACLEIVYKNINTMVNNP